MKSKRLVFFGTLLSCLILGSMVAQAIDNRDKMSLVGSTKPADEAARLRTIDQLGARGEKAAEAVGPLTELLKDNSAKVRAHAACALGEIGAPAKPAVPALAELLKDPDETVRRQAVKAVMHIHPGPQVTIPLCVKLLEDSDPGVRVRVLNAVAEAGPKAVPGLIAALKSDKAAYWACLVLREIGPAAKDAVPALLKRLRDSRPEIRREAILALAAVEENDVCSLAPIAGAIAAELGDKDNTVAATYALGRLGIIPVHIIRTWKTEIDGGYKDEGTAEQEPEAVVRQNAKSDDKMLRTTSLWALARVHPEDKQLRREATEQLIARLKDEDPFVREAAAHALFALPPAPEITRPIWEKAFQDADEMTVRYALDAFAALGPQAVPKLIDAMKREKFRGQAAYVLGQIGPAAAPATPALAQLIADKDERVAHEAVMALAKIGPGAKGAVPALVGALQQVETANSNAPAIAYALGKIGPDAAEAEPVLSRLLKSPDGNLALACAWAIIQIHPAPGEVAEKTLPVLIAGLTNPLPLARRGAAEALGRLGPSAKEATAALQKAMNDEDKTVRDAAAKAVQLIGGGAAGQG